MSILIFFFFSGVTASSEAKVQDNRVEIEKVYNAIYRVGYKNPQKGMKIAGLIYKESIHYNINPKVLVAIIMVESSFRQDVVSSTGDISLAQINVKTWTKEFKRLKRKGLDEKRMHKEPAYAIARMAEILSILAERHEGKKDWFAYYHSSTPEHKKAYFNRVVNKLAMMDKTLSLINSN